MPIRKTTKEEQWEQEQEVNKDSGDFVSLIIPIFFGLNVWWWKKRRTTRARRILRAIKNKRNASLLTLPNYTSTNIIESAGYMWWQRRRRRRTRTKTERTRIGTARKKDEQTTFCCLGQTNFINIILATICDNENMRKGRKETNKKKNMKLSKYYSADFVKQIIFY